MKQRSLLNGKIQAIHKKNDLKKEVGRTIKELSNTSVKSLKDIIGGSEIERLRMGISNFISVNLKFNFVENRNDIDLLKKFYDLLIKTRGGKSEKKQIAFAELFCEWKNIGITRLGEKTFKLNDENWSELIKYTTCSLEKSNINSINYYRKVAITFANKIENKIKEGVKSDRNLESKDYFDNLFSKDIKEGDLNEFI